MADRRQHAAFRPDPNAAPATTPSRRQAFALVAVLVLIAAAIAVASFAVKPSKARSFDLFQGSVLINDNRAPVSVDLASGKPTVKLIGAYTQVNAKKSGDLDVVPLTGGTLLLDTSTGEFNMAYSSGYAVKPTGGGVPLSSTNQPTNTTGIAAGESAYIVRTGADGTSVYLVGKSTVSSAAAGGKATPRASADMREPARDVSTSAASANGNLWILVGTGGKRIIRQLSVPTGSNPGVTLTTNDHGTVDGAAAIGVSSRARDGSGGDVIAVASASAIRVFNRDGSEHTLSLTSPPGVDTILPATNQQGGFAFLYHSASGWSVVHAGVDGSQVAAVRPLTELPPTAVLAVPAQSSGKLYTADLGSGALYQFSAAGKLAPVAGDASYPIVDGETHVYTDTTVLARGARVIFNSRANLKALTVFSDGSHAPVVIDKRVAVTLSANGAAALADAHRGATEPSPSNAPPTTKPNPAQQVTDKIDCKATTQIPHVPTVQLVDRGSRSAQLQWTYPLLSPQDCAPSTYTVTVKLVSDNAPPPPKVLTVQGQTGVNLVGLFPDTQYQMIVTAYLNGKGTPSQPLPVRTAVEGPAAPTGVKASPDDHGDWTVTWNSCGGIKDNCVPAASWTVVPQLCDEAAGLQNAPANGHLVGDPTSHTFTLVYKGDPDLLGRGLSFQVEGVGTTGVTGTASKSSACTYSWAHPVPENIHVAASLPPGGTSVGGSTSANVTVSFTGDPNVAMGGAGGQLTYQLLSGGSVLTTKGPTSNTSVALPGVTPGQSYSVRVLVSPPRHQSASVSLPAVDVSPAVANWPALSASASFDASGSNSTGTLTVKISGVSSSDARGETFDLTDSSLNCGNYFALTKTNFDPANALTFTGIDRSQYHGDCTVSIKLAEDPSTVRSPAYFGGTPSGATPAAAVSIPVPKLDTSASDFKANFVSNGILAPDVAVSYTGSNGLLATYATGWSLQLQYRDGGSWTDCGSASGANLGGQAASLHTAPCYYSHSDASWQVVVNFSYFGQSPPGSGYQIAVGGTGPKPIDPAKLSFTANWSGNDIDVHPYGYDTSTLAQLSWTLTVTADSSTGGACASTTSGPGADGWQLAVNLTTCPAMIPSGGTGAPPGGGSSSTPATYTVTVAVTDPYGTSQTYKNPADFSLTGSPPE